MEPKLKSKVRKTFKKNPKKFKFKCVVQKYIENPLLLHKKKFDIRCYVLIVKAKPLIALYHHGYLRLSLREYDDSLLTGSEGRIIHLTNAAVQKKHKEFKEKKEETIWSMQRFKDYFVQKLGNSEDAFEEMNKMTQQVLSAAIFAGQGKIQQLDGCFELLGCDILIDEEFRPHLIEMNTNPALYLDTKTQKKIIPQVVNKTLDIVTKVNEFPEEMQKLYTANSANAVPGWTLIYNQATDYFVH